MTDNPYVQGAIATLIAVGWKVAGALALWIIGRLLILIDRGGRQLLKAFV